MWQLGLRISAKISFLLMVASIFFISISFIRNTSIFPLAVMIPSRLYGILQSIDYAEFEGGINLFTSISFNKILGMTLLVIFQCLNY